jgi:hypothetical protein
METHNISPREEWDSEITNLLWDYGISIASLCEYKRSHGPEVGIEDVAPGTSLWRVCFCLSWKHLYTSKSSCAGVEDTRDLIPSHPKTESLEAFETLTINIIYNRTTSMIHLLLRCTIEKLGLFKTSTATWVIDLCTFDTTSFLSLSRNARLDDRII